MRQGGGTGMRKRRPIIHPAACACRRQKALKMCSGNSSPLPSGGSGRAGGRAVGRGVAPDGPRPPRGRPPARQRGRRVAYASVRRRWQDWQEGWQRHAERRLVEATRSEADSWRQKNTAAYARFPNNNVIKKAGRRCGSARRHAAAGREPGLCSAAPWSRRRFERGAAEL